MAGFEDRQKTYEKKFAHDEETKFKVNARRNKLLGLWAAELLGIQGAEAEAYAKQVVRADFDEPGEEDVFRKVSGDLEGKNVSEKDIRHEMSRLMDVAKEQVSKEV